MSLTTLRSWRASDSRNRRSRSRRRSHESGPRQPTLAKQLGIYQDPWFGEVAICERAGAIDFAAAKSPLLSGEVMQAGERLLVDWRDDSIDAEAWLDFSSPAARRADGAAVEQSRSRGGFQL